MFVKVKVVDTVGNTKGRAYTYESDIEVAEGDKVIADMAGSDKVLIVVGMAEPSDYENVDFEIKKIKSIYTGEADSDGVLPDETIDISVEEVLPVIKISNYETLKTQLSEMLKKYQNIIVTEQTLPGCKATQRELAGLRTKVDNYRKDKKKVMSAPITAFEDDCKTLIGLIEQAEAPIKEGIKVFDDKKRDVNRIAAVKIIEDIAKDTGLLPKYAARIEVAEKYCQLSAKESDTKVDVQAKAYALKVEQDRELELIDIIIDSIETENKRIDTKLKFEDFQRAIDRGTPTKDILAEIKTIADRIYKAEHPEPKVEVAPESPQALTPEIKPVAVETVKPTESMYYAVYRVEGTAKQLVALSEYIVSNGMTKAVLEQGAM